ncbi:uncharacterized protein KY384_002235 [Bacidia gigantensis]|uniref:uncharacterized protein n=1 Tax=Bacidia gigantensis TaxID=2732470 RepID=UPI001D0524A0|nr:uncharacterized protein KY384_002235 [Bacidia gigantensis]KAG8533452.1 hypothetical protein KY384_002235 [Bacidia gigantensis]
MAVKIMDLSKSNRFYPWLSVFGFVLLLLSTYHLTKETSWTGSISLKSDAVAPVGPVVPVAPVALEASGTEAKVGLHFGDPDGELTLSDNEFHKLLDHGLHKRQNFWNNAIRNGQAKIDLMNGPRVQARLSNYYDLAANGWDYEDEVRDEAMVITGKWVEIYEQLGIDPENDNDIDNHQSQRFSNCMFRNLPPTGGSFENRYNPKGRMITGVNNYSPYSKLQGQANVTIGTNTNVAPFQRVPDLQKWSQVVAIVWSHLAGNDAHNLKYIFKMGIVTTATQQVMIEAARRQPINMQSANTFEFTTEWPGYKFGAGSDGYAALMGTPHGVGIAYLLHEHPDQFGTKTVESITIFTNPDDYPTYHMLFTLTD